MNRGLAIGVFALVAVIMGMSSIAPALASVDPGGGPRELCEKIRAGLIEAGLSEEQIREIISKIPACGGADPR